jgi:DNA-binding GntR family transcriptional regulator
MKSKNETGRKSKKEKNKNHAASPVDVAFNKIKEMMYHHEIVPGQKLLYQELAKKLEMSVTPIIQALNRLQFLNIVYSERNKGYYVGEVDPVEAEELFSVREALEVYIVPDIIQKLNQKKLTGIEKALNAHMEAVTDPGSRSHLLYIDTNFHLKIIQSAENKVIYNTSKIIFERIYLKYRPEYMREERIKTAADEHQILFKALKEKDASKVKRLLKQHIRAGREHVAESLVQPKRVAF